MTLTLPHAPLDRRAYYSPVLTERLALLLQAAGRRLLRHAAESNRRRTALQLEGLPFDVRKDIGWPADDIGNGPKT
jgi:hypothetical protein